MKKNSARATKKPGATASTNRKAAAKNLHVVHHSEGWVIRPEGSTRVSSLHDTQREAVEAALALAKQNATTLVIHSRDGRVKERNSFSPNPNPPRKLREVLYPTTPPRTASKKAIKRAVSQAITKVAVEELRKTKSSNVIADESRKSRAVSKRNSRREQAKA